MKILQVVTLSQWGGAQRIALDYSRILRDSGYRVALSSSPGGELEERAGGEKITFYPLRMKRKISPLSDLKSLLALRELVKKEGFQVLHSHSTKAGLLSRNPAVPGVKIFTAHGWCFTPGARNRACKFLEKIAARFSWKIICVSLFDLRLALDAGIKRSKLAYIPNGIGDVETISDPALSPVIVSVARFSPQKDHRTLLRALAGLPGAEAWLVGEGPLLETVRKMAEEMGVSRRVKFMGFRRNIEEILSRAGVFVLSSRWEGLPISVIEAMRSALPVVATRVGGLEELVVDGVSGFLVPPQNPAVLREKLRVLLENPSLRRDMGMKGREIYLSRYTLEKMKEGLLELYRSLPL